MHQINNCVCVCVCECVQLQKTIIATVLLNDDLKYMYFILTLYTYNSCGPSAIVVLSSFIRRRCDMANGSDLLNLLAIREREGGREGEGEKGGRERRRERGRERGREGEREGGREGEKEREREGGRERSEGRQKTNKF